MDIKTTEEAFFEGLEETEVQEVQDITVDVDAALESLRAAQDIEESFEEGQEVFPDVPVNVSIVLAILYKQDPQTEDEIINSFLK